MFIAEYYPYFNYITIFLFFLFPFFLYAEIHYKPTKLFKGFLYKEQPEILFDVPRRIEKTSLPIALIIKDCNEFPIKLKSIKISISIDSEIQEEFQYQENLALEDKFYSKIYPLDMEKYVGKNLQIQCELSYKSGDKRHSIINNNYSDIEEEYLNVYIDPDNRPSLSNWKWGDLHCHSHYTEDQVEFGMPLSLFPQIGNSMGMEFSAITDHSYDLDTTQDSWTETDPDLNKWHNFQSEIKEINRSRDNFTLLPGEEISVDNGLDRSVHLTVLNSDQYFPGSGDSFRNGFRESNELHYTNILDNLPEDTLAFAAHPYFKPSRLEKILLKRGVWNSNDHHNKLSGYQIYNGIKPLRKDVGKNQWIETLLKGRKKLIYAGNDSHGFLNRFIGMKHPLLSLEYSHDHLFGEMLTGIKQPGNSVEEIITGLKTKPTIVSNGPVLDISIISNKKNKGSTLNLFENEDRAEITETLEGRPAILKMEAESTPYFGKIKKITSYLSDQNGNQEVEINTYNTSSYNFEATLNLHNLPRKGYIRSELITEKDCFAITNPIWFESTN